MLGCACWQYWLLHRPCQLLGSAAPQQGRVPSCWERLRKKVHKWCHRHIWLGAIILYVHVPAIPPSESELHWTYADSGTAGSKPLRQHTRLGQNAPASAVAIISAPRRATASKAFCILAETDQVPAVLDSGTLSANATHKLFCLLDTAMKL